jgi:hypothetical protein
MDGKLELPCLTVSIRMRLLIVCIGRSETSHCYWQSYKSLDNE